MIWPLAAEQLGKVGAGPKVNETLFSKTGISKEHFDKWAPEIRDDITFTCEALDGA